MKNNGGVDTVPGKKATMIRPPEAWKGPVHMPWLAGIFVLLLIHLLGFAQTILVPVALALFLSLVLRPVVRALERIHVKPGAGAALVLITIIFVLVFCSVQLAAPAREWVSEAPERMSKVETKVRNLLQPFEEARKAVDDLSLTPDGGGKQLVTVSNSFGSDVLAQSRTVFGHGVLVVILLFFLLSSGDHFWSGIWQLFSWWIDKDMFMHVVHNTESRLSTYLLTVTLINMALGLLIGLGMFIIGMPNPVLWGALAMCLNFVPYLGALVGEVIVGMVALFAFDTVGHALLAPLIYLAVAFIEGSFITPMVLGRKFTIRPVLILLSMIFFGWVWGTVGVFLAVPVLVLAGIVSESVPSLGRVERFLKA